jgi:hypothetical protein
MAKKTKSNKSTKCNYGKYDSLNMNPKGNMYPDTSTFDHRYSYFNNPVVSMNSHPMFYIGQRVNTLGSNNPSAYAVMRYGNTLQNPVLSLSVDARGTYKLVNDHGKSYKIYHDSSNGGNYIIFTFSQ